MKTKDKYFKSISYIKINTFQSGILKKIINILKMVETTKVNDRLLIEYQTLPIKIKKFTVQRAPHVFKKTREQFEVRTNTYLISIERLRNKARSNNTPKEYNYKDKDIVNNILFKLMQLDGVSIQLNYLFNKKD